MIALAIATISASSSPSADLMAALKRSLAREALGSKHTTPKKANKMGARSPGEELMT
jgi:hypothetical protein